ncbi:hypothetical protein LGN17_32240 [Burkholderia sp. AU30280]|uniref:hypothetical protein n=1 Tax=Burkholderia sp. AU30280 TaxID=2879628 RepID=UPI001CF191EF|nr:hypothetical protein [Burkholderia sp. AU30280]MCA8277157.1 hypothetical protein [Burkholderia sp. AU30280]
MADDAIVRRDALRLIAPFSLWRPSNAGLFRERPHRGGRSAIRLPISTGGWGATAPPRSNHVVRVVPDTGRPSNFYPFFPTHFTAGGNSRRLNRRGPFRP